MPRNPQETAAQSTQESARPDRSAQARAAVTVVRTRVAQVVWVVCVAAAVFLAAGALCIALKANPDNALVKFILQTADKLDLGVFSRGKKSRCGGIGCCTGLTRIDTRETIGRDTSPKRWFWTLSAMPLPVPVSRWHCGSARWQIHSALERTQSLCVERIARPPTIGYRGQGWGALAGYLWKERP